MLSEQLHAWVNLLTTWLALGLLLMVFLVTVAAMVLWVQDRYFQKAHAIRRNYPLIGRFRYFFEHIGEFFRQYFFAMDREELPFNRAQRSWVYRAAKDLSNTVAFGTTKQNAAGRIVFLNTPYPTLEKDAAETLPLMIGPHADQPFVARSFHNISAMSFGALSTPAVRALSRGAGQAGCWLNTGEGGLTEMHLEGHCDLVFQIGTAYYGVRDQEGNLSDEKLREVARLQSVKMFEIKLSQGAKPGHGGILPKHKITAEIASTRGIPMGEDCVSPSRHSAFSTPTELLQFIAQLRELSGGKPVGFKFCLGHPWEFMGIVKAMLETGILPDFIVVDGKEGGTGAAPLEFTDHLGVPLREGLLFVHNTLVGSNLRDKIKLGASGKIVSAFDIARVLAIGADWANSARGFMFAIGCIQSQSCHTNKCPTGVATQDPLRQRALVVEDKAQRVHNFHRNTLRALAEMLAAAGLDHPAQIDAKHLVQRMSATEIKLFAQQHVFLAPGELVSGKISGEFYERMWNMARADSFEPALA